MTVDSKTAADAPSKIVRLPQASGERIDIGPTVQSLRPVILAQERLIDEQRRIPAALVDALFEAGLFQTIHPRELGGIEMHPVDFMDWVFELSRINGTVGWISLFQTGGIPLFGPEVMRELADKAGGRVIFAGSHNRTGRAVRVDGGYRVSGDWVFASGSAWATYMTAWSQVIGPDGEPELDPVSGDPVKIDAILPVDSVNRLDNWDTMGLRGTSSGQFTVDDVFVEERFVTDGLPHEAYVDRPILTALWATPIAAMYLGTAQGAIDRHIAAGGRARGKDTTLDDLRLMKIAEAEAMILATRDLAWKATESEFAPPPTPEGGGEEYQPNKSTILDNGIPVDFLAPLTEGFQAVAYAATVAKKVVNLVFEAASTDAVRTDRGIERCFRDVYTGTMHAGAAYRNLSMRGEYLMTKDQPDGPTLTFPPSLL
jgi:alkylation response protein AidB-like acyl-CoA dehydrogenase